MPLIATSNWPLALLLSTSNKYGILYIADILVLSFKYLCEFLDSWTYFGYDFGGTDDVAVVASVIYTFNDGLSSLHSCYLLSV